LEVVGLAGEQALVLFGRLAELVGRNQDPGVLPADGGVVSEAPEKFFKAGDSRVVIPLLDGVPGRPEQDGPVEV
jgi:hypothetical protein